MVLLLFSRNDKNEHQNLDIADITTYLNKLIYHKS